MQNNKKMLQQENMNVPMGAVDAYPPVYNTKFRNNPDVHLLVRTPK
jgi:hypothetical protein